MDYGDDERGEKDPVFTVIALQDIKLENQNCIFLIDHQLSYKLDSLKKDISENPAIVKRLCAMMGLSTNDDIDGVLRNIWKFCSFYSLNAQGNEK